MVNLEINTTHKKELWKMIICDKCGREFIITPKFCGTFMDKDGHNAKIIFCPYCDALKHEYD